jgi:spermidine/putrescine transport system substrate-binding protein
VARHPRERRRAQAGSPPLPAVPWLTERALSRRDFLVRGAGAAAAMSGAAAFLAACGHASPSNASTGGGSGSGSDQGLPFALSRPDSPATLPLFDDNPAIASGLAPETNTTLQIYNWADYIWKKVVNDFGTKYGVKVQISTFDNTDEFLAKISSGQVSFDVTFPTPDLMGKLAAAKVLQPLNHDYLSNLSNIWPQLQNPWYDQGSRYSVPYTVYTTGIGWRNDLVSTDIASMSNPYEIFWDPANRGKVYILDDYREAPAMVLLKNGITDINTTSASALQKARSDLLAMISATNVKYDVNDYTELPEGRAAIHQAWSGDMVSAPYYLPKGGSAKTLSYWFPPDGRGVIGNDCIAIPKNAKNPVLAHLFLDYMLDPKIAYSNFVNFNGYQPPQNDIDPDRLVSDGVVPSNLVSTVVKPTDFQQGFQFAALSPSADAAWHSVWQDFQAGA